MSPMRNILRRAFTDKLGREQGIVCAINHQHRFCQRAEHSQFWSAAHACISLPPSALVSNSITAFNPSAGAPVLPQQDIDKFSLVSPFSQALIGLVSDWLRQKALIVTKPPLTSCWVYVLWSVIIAIFPKKLWQRLLNGGPFLKLWPQKNKVTPWFIYRLG